MPESEGIGMEILNYLATNSMGTVGRDLFLEFMPADATVPNTITTSVFIDGGNATIESSTIPNLTFQVLVRADQTTYSAGRAKAVAIYNLLHNQKAFLAESVVSLCKGTNFPPQDFKDLEEDWNFSMSFVMTVKEAF